MLILKCGQRFLPKHRNSSVGFIIKKLYTVSEPVTVFAVRSKVHMDLILQSKSKFCVLFVLGIKPHLRLSRVGLFINAVIYGKCSIINYDVPLMHRKAVRLKVIQTFSAPSTCI
jgi:hypothetical protein